MQAANAFWCHSQLLPFCEYVFVPGKSPVEVQPEILDILLKKVKISRVAP
jgi:hypothetical protein